MAAHIIMVMAITMAIKYGNAGKDNARDND